MKQMSPDANEEGSPENKIEQTKNEELLYFLRENGKIANSFGLMNSKLMDLKFAIRDKNLEEASKYINELEANAFWATTTMNYLRYQSVVANIADNKIRDEKIKYLKPKPDLENVKKFIESYMPGDKKHVFYKWEGGKVVSFASKESASYELLKKLLDYLSVELVDAV